MSDITSRGYKDKKSPFKLITFTNPRPSSPMVIQSKDTNIYSNFSQQKYHEDHMANLKLLKESLYTEDKIDAPKKLLGSSSSRFRFAQSDGFTSNNIPHITTNSGYLKDNRRKYKLYNDQLMKCSTIKEEEKESIVKNIENFENNKRLPTISTIYNQNEIKNVSISIRWNKIMGEKYNPLNFSHDKLKSTTKRNCYGALFQH